jgi:hypothetical protein
MRGSVLVVTLIAYVVSASELGALLLPLTVELFLCMAVT